MKCNPNSKSSKVVTPAYAKYRADVKVKSSVCDNVSYTSSYRRISDWLDSKHPISHEDRMKEVRWTFGASLILLLPWCMFELPDNSMSPTLESGYDVMGWRTKKRKRLKPLSVVAMVEYDDKHEYKILMCRRIIGMPGDTVKIYGNGLISVNGKQLREPYLKDYTYKAKPQTIVVPKNQYFVLGDNRKKSWDSRDFGCIKYSQIKHVITRALSPTSSTFTEINKLSKLSE